MSPLYEKILSALKEIPLVDVHSHISVDHPQVNDTSEILFYHFLRREVYSAGLPEDDFLVSNASLEKRMAYFFPYLKYIENTATFWCIRKILEDIYEIPHGELNQSNWKKIQEKIKQRKRDNNWPRKMMEKAGIERSLICGSEWKKKNLEKYPFLSPLFENLECFSFDPERTSSLLDLTKEHYGFLPETVSGYEELLSSFFKEKVKEGVSYFTCFISSSLKPMKGGKERIEAVYKKKTAGRELTSEEQNILITWLLYSYLGILKEVKHPAQFCIGAWWARPGLRYGESYVLTNHHLIFDLISVFKDFPDVKISIMYAACSLSQELTIISRMLPNVSLLGFWWHTLFPSYIERIIAERLEALPANKWIAIATDAYSVEWAYGKVKLVLHCLARVLCDKIEQGYFSQKKALWIARRVLYHNPKEIYGL